MRNGLVFCLSAILCTAAASAQEQQQPTFHSESNVVMVPTLVRDRNREIIYDLKAEDFVVEDDGVPQTVHLDESAQFRPAEVVVAVQIGRRADYELPRLRGLKSMLYPLFDQGHGEVAIIAFDSQVRELQNFSGDDAKTSRVLDSLQPGDGGAAIFDAVASGLRMLANTPKDRQRVLLLVSETRDHGSKSKPLDLLRELGSSNAVVYALTFSPSKSNLLDTLRGNNNPDFHPEETEVHEGPDLLAPLILLAQGTRKNAAKTITAMTGGEYANFSTSKNFDRDMTEFTNHLYARYLLSFAPGKPHPGLHQITVKLKQHGNATVSARASYWAAPDNSRVPAQ